jgi:hypothetical protein
VCVVISERCKQRKQRRLQNNSCTYPVEVGVERKGGVDGQAAEAGGDRARRQRFVRSGAALAVHGLAVVIHVDWYFGGDGKKRCEGARQRCNGYIEKNLRYTLMRSGQIQTVGFTPSRRNSRLRSASKR